MTEVIKIDGAPGVGKSTKLFEFVGHEKAEEGRPLTAIYYMTFARSGKEESARRLAEVYPDADEDELSKRAKTFHGVACTACLQEEVFEDIATQIIQRGSDDDVYQRFADRHGLDYDPHANDPLRPGDDGDPVDPSANRLFVANDYLSLLRRGPEHYKHAPVDLPWPGSQTKGLLRAWDAFKRAGRPDEGLRLFEHADYVDMAIDEQYLPTADVLFIDEFQDLSPQEYALYKSWRDSGHLDRIYIAGDPNQSIYSFRAGRPDYFEQTDVDETITLKTSYRCPSRITATASTILANCSETDPRGFDAHRDGGGVEELSISRPEDLADRVKRAVERHAGDGSDVYLLARTNYHANDISKALQARNLPYEWLGRRRGAWTDDMRQLFAALRDLRRDEPVLAVGVKRLLENTPGNRTAKLAGDGGLLWPEINLYGDYFAAEDVWRAYDDCRSVVEIAKKTDLRGWRRSLLAAALRSEHSIDPDQIKVGTIHAAKGLEAPCVFLFDGYTPRILDAYENGENTAEEHRLYYVGATRASETLYIVRDYFGGETFPGLATGQGVVA